jgi:hypothetical protein
MKTFVFSLLFGALLSGNAQTQDFVAAPNAQEADKLTKNLYAAADMMVGTFTNREQAATSNSPLHREQTIVTRRVMRKDKAHIWIYMAWYQPHDRSTPLDHRIFQLSENENGEMTVIPFHIAPNTDLARLSQDDLTADVCVCNMQNLTEDPQFTYKFGTTDKNWCESNVEGGMYKYVEMDFRFHEEGFSMFHNFYSSEKSPLFGYPEGSHFKRMEE